jgi:glycosyltransferase involved in cell wall biosynthesis
LTLPLEAPRIAITNNRPARPSLAATHQSSRRSAKRVRILHVISGLFYGGGQRVVIDLLKSLPRAGPVDVRLCTLGEVRGSPLASYRDFNVKYSGRYNSPRVLFDAARRLRKVIAAASVDIVHTHGIDADLIGVLALCGRPERTVCHLHITPPTDRRESWKAAIRRNLFRSLATRNRTWFIAVADSVRERTAEYYRLSSERIVTVRNGIDLSEFEIDNVASTRRGSGRVVFGTAARLVPAKGLAYLIEAAARLARKNIPFEVRIAGTGSELKSLERLAQSLGLSDRVRFLGQVTDMPGFYRGLDVFVLPSLSEGLPLVVLEAMAMGKPIAATSLAGTAEVVRDGVDGLLVPPADANALEDALERLADDPSLRQRMGAAGRQRALADFCIDRVARKVVQLYERILIQH